MLRGRLSRIDRTTSLVLSAIWLALGGAALVLGFLRGSLPLLALSLPALGFGAVWARVAWHGRLLDASRRR